ncbi:MAG TPA: hypothetical protein VMB91_02285 [Solirubrobacteraceae bacterium]|nr:hypothetical protein [Solirubrobacteraceae bacterium]
MKKLSRRSILRSGPARLSPLASGASEEVLEEGTSRKAFLQGTAGAAASAALVLATPKVAAVALDGSTPAPAAGPKAIVTSPSGRAPREPVTAFVRDAERGEVTVLSGTNRTTYRDPVLVKRMLDAAR